MRINQETGSPFTDLQQDMIDDLAPHLNGHSWDSPELQQFLRWVDAGEAKQRVAEARSRGAVKAAKTRAKNADAGVSRKGIITGSTKQKQWAAEIRAKARVPETDFCRDMLSGARETGSKFWIDNRKGNDIFHAAAYAERLYRELETAYAAVPQMPAGHVLSDDDRRLVEAFNDARAAYRTYVAI